MKILRIHENPLTKGGTGVHIQRLQSGMAAKGVSSPLLELRPSGSGYFWKFESETPQIVSNSKETTDKLLKFSSDQGFDLVQIHGVKIPKVLARFLGEVEVPVIRYMHEPRLVCPGHGKYWYSLQEGCDKRWGLHCFAHAYKEGCAPRHPLKLLAAWRNTSFEINHATKHYRRVIVASKFMKTLAEEGGIPSHLISIIPPPQIPPEQTNRKPHQFSGNNLLFVGRIAPTKGISQMIEALTPILKSNSSIRLHIVGEGISRKSVEAKVETEGLAKQVLFHGWKNQQEITSFYEQADLVLFPSMYPEAFGNVGPEAMLHRKPVIGFDVGGVSEWLIHNKTGLIVPAGDIERFRQAVIKLLDNPEQSDSFGEFGYTYVKEKFSLGSVCKRYLDLFRQLLPGSNLPTQL